MARNKTPGDAPRRGEVVKPRSQVNNEVTGTWTKRERIGLRDNEIKTLRAKSAPKEITRFEVIDETGRVYVRDPRASGGQFEIELSYQDDGRTLKVFVTPR